MNELYWISVVGKLNTAFWVGVGACLTILLVAFVVLIANGVYEEESACLKRVCQRCAIIAMVLSLCAIMTPSKRELYLIYGAGTILDYCKGDSKVREIPDKAIDSLNRYLDSIAESKGELI